MNIVMVKVLKTYGYGLLVAALSGAILSGCGRSSEHKGNEAVDKLTQAAGLLKDQRYVEALNLARDVVQLNSQLQNDTALANSYLFLARCHREIGVYDSALYDYEHAAQCAHNVAEKRLERKAQIELAEFDLSMGRCADAFTLASDAATEAKLFGDLSDRYTALATVASANHSLRRYDDEQQALGEMILIDSLAQRGRAHDSLQALLFRSVAAQGKPDAIYQAFRRWYVSASALHDDFGRANAWYEYGVWQQHNDMPDSAFHAFSRALDALGAETQTPLQLSIWTSLGNVSYGQRRFDNATTYYSNGLALAQKLHKTASSFVFRLALLATEWKRQPHGNPAEYLRAAQRIADSCHQAGFRRGEAFADFLAGILAEQRNDADHAAAYYQKSWSILGESFNTRHDFFDIFLEVEGRTWSDPLLKAFCVANQADSAFVLAENVNRHDLIDFLSGVRLRTIHEDLNQRVADVQWLYQSMKVNENEAEQALEDDPPRATDVRVLYLDRQISADLDRIGVLSSELGKVNNNFSLMFSRRPIGLHEIQGALTPGNGLLEFIPLENQLYVLLVKNDTSFLIHVNVNRTYLLSLVGDYLHLMGELRLSSFGLRMSEPAALRRINELSSVLYNFIIAPVSKEIVALQKLYVVLPESFSWLPVHTLRGDGSALGQRINISYLPSAAALLFSQPKEMWVKKVIGLGHPGSTTWDVEYELKDIRSFFDKAAMFFDTSATLTHLADSTYDLLHLAGEFLLDRDVAENSHIVLADGRTSYGTRDVSLGEMLHMPVPEILVFSNISDRPGGLQRYAPYLFLANGSSTVIATMWQGDRRTKKAFGEGFYTNLFMGITATDSYFKAISAVAKREELSHVQRWGMYYQFGK